MQIIETFYKLNKYSIRKNFIWLRFFLITLILVGAIWNLLYLNWIQINIVIPYANFIAGLSGKLLKLLFHDVQVQESTIWHPQGITMIVGAKCTGLFQIAFLISGILATPSKSIHKLRGIILGSIILSVINIFRLITIFMVGYYSLKYLYIFHDIIWESLMIVLTFFTWYVWKIKTDKKANLTSLKSS